MEKKEPIKISLPIFISILVLLVAIAFGCYMFIQNQNLEKQIANLKDEINKSQTTKNELQEKLNKVSNAISSDIQNTTTSNSISTESKNSDVTYEITQKGDAKAMIKATKDGKTVSKEFEMDAEIDKTGTLDIPNVGKVAVVCDSGGEYYGVNIFQLVNDEIKKIGNINMGADTVKEATYTVENKNQYTVVINAQRNSEKITNEFEMNAEIANTNVVDIFGTKVVMIAEKGGEYYGIQVYRLSQDYTNGKIKEIINVGTITPDFSK